MNFILIACLCADLHRVPIVADPYSAVEASSHDPIKVWLYLFFYVLVVIYMLRISLNGNGNGLVGNGDDGDWLLTMGQVVL